MSLTLFELDQRFIDVVKQIEETGGEITPDLGKAYDNICFDLLQKEENYIKIVEHFDSQIELGKKIVDRINKRLKMFKGCQERLKQNLIYSMQQREIKTVETEIGKIHLQQSESIKNLPISEYPQEFIKTKIIEEVDKENLKKACKENSNLAKKYIEKKSFIKIY